MSECSICVTNESFKLGGKSKLNANATIALTLLSNVKGVAKLNANKIQQPALLKCKTSGSSKIRSTVNLSQNIFALQSTDNSNIIRPHLKVNGILRSKLSSKSKLNNKYTDKFAGSIGRISSINEFAGVQKLYPINDIVTSLNNSYFVNKLLSSGNLYDSVDEGIFIGNYNQNLSKSQRLSDDNTSFIQPSSIFTSGTFRYKCEVSRPYHHPKESFLFIRAAAPLYNYGSRVAPEYRIHNIRFEDPSGNIIVRYKDIALKGDADYQDHDILNYATYISEPETNNATLNTWDDNYPILGEASGYTLNMDFDIICLDDPFSPGFSAGYEEKSCELKFVNTGNNDYQSLDGSPLSTHTQGYHLNPTNTIRISAIEIVNSGDLCNLCSVSGIKNDNYFGFYLEVNPIGQRISRTIYPSELFIDNYNVGIYPETYSTWLSSPETAYNTTVSGSKTLLSAITNLENTDYITLFNSTPLIDSGRLTLKFNHKPPQPVTGLINGAFDLSANKEFNRANFASIAETDSFFVVDSVELKIVAKKAIGSRDYALDVVGYSDDKLLHVTPKLGAFLQNKLDTSYIVDENINYLVSEVPEFIVDTDETGSVPLTSGFKQTNDFGLSSESLSEKDQYFENYLTSIDAGDHYKLSKAPVVNSTNFTEYTIPLQIYEDYVDVGKPRDYSMSSYFENLFIDLYPIPSGASIASIRLIVHYKPSNGMTLHTFGTPLTKQLDRKDIRLLPIGVAKNADSSLNNQSIEIVYLVDELNDFIVSENNEYIAESGLVLSKIDQIPHGYSNQETLKTNYSRRWRGVDGNIVSGPYDVNQFGFSFYNPESNHPFLDGYFDLNHASGRYLLSTDFANSGYYNGSDAILKNIGLRFNNSQLFNITTSYTTIDWTQAGDNIYGKILDAYDSAIRVSGQYGNINFGNKKLNNGFAFYTRFTPDQSISGAGYNLFNSGVIASKWNSGNNLEFALAFKNGYLSLLAQDINNNIIELNDTTPYYDYQYPLSVIATYIPGIPSGQLRLYCNNELSNGVYLRDIENIVLNSGDSDFVVGHSYGSGVGINAFIHEVGFSTSGNLVHSSPNRLLKQTTANSFLDGHSHTLLHNITNNKFKLDQYINDNTSSWKLGDFKICSFSPDFDGFTTRIGKDYLIHTLKHHGSGYSQITNLPLPSSINASGLSYHSQIENDFIRFNLQDMPDANPEFYSVSPRICKTLPRDYDFVERAMVVDTVIEHETNNDILWPDGKVGPKLIVSLYSKNQDPVDRPSKKNWGLINRSIHYLAPSGCYEKISSTFNYNDLIDISEPWALFDLDNIRSEFDHKYYSTDINDMFLQYDLVYPSGSPFESIIKIHSANVRLENALTYWADSNNQLSLYASGESIRYAGINLYGIGLDTISDSGLILYTNGSAWPATNNSINLCVSGIYGIPESQFNLFVKNSGVVSSLGPDLYISGCHPREEETMSLVMIDNTLDQTRFNSLPIFVKNKEPVLIEDSFPLSMPEPYAISEYEKISRMNLYLANDQILVYNLSQNFNLYINTDLGYELSSGNFSLYTINYLAYNQQINQQASISWNMDNVGGSIDAILDSGVPYLNANDEIRGADLLCYGNCNSINKCLEEPITVHDLSWYGDQSCIEGGIFRVKNTYTNLAVSGFKTPIGYSGNFYGIRKYEGLIPNAPYNITIATKTGQNASITLPTQALEIDYGSNEYVNYSGIKLAADYGLTDNERQIGNKYGKSVAVKKDLIAVGAPMQTVSYSEYDSSGNLVTTNLSEAGSVFLYRRNARPSGYSWPENEHKSSWQLETKLTLPSGFLKDYPTLVESSINGIPTYQRYWNVGQEGRQLGSSLDLGINYDIKSFEENQREILVVGGPTAKWSRDFEDLNTSGVSIGLLIFTDEFVETIIDPNNMTYVRTYRDILNAIKDKDIIFRYFCDPPVKFDVKIIICEPKANITNIETFDFSEPKPTFITKKAIPRNQGVVTEEDTAAIFSGIKTAFDETFPYDNSKICNNIPVMLGVYVDNSRSLGRKALSPGLDRFLSYYQEYSFASGVQDFFGVKDSGAIYEYQPIFFSSEDWISLATTALDQLLDTGRLFSSNQIRFFASGIGPESFNINLSQFNYPPNSGGRVYIFEKESGSWNLIQEIQSPVISYDTIDKFGHAVAISEDTNVIAIGSPYINQCCKIYEYKPEEKNRLFNSLYSWLPYKNSTLGGNDQRYTTLMENYLDWLNNDGPNIANKNLYANLTQTEKFEARKYLNIQEYADVFTYTYNNIPYVGTWDFIPKNFAPSSRLGYSVAVNDDGSIVAFGAPTDSFNQFDDYNVYYKNDGYNDPLNIDNLNGTITSSWRSNVNAGAVRLFESRKYYPHNKAVEFGKFGNLQESLGDPLDSGHFNYLSAIFQNKNFVKMSENETSIPTDAGLAFIITPGVDALSQEILDNLISWLSLGDRNLVLVGNDPVWEASGIYSQSNNIINKILDGLNSRMRLHPAKNEYESLPSGGSLLIPSFRPAMGTPTYIQSHNLSTAYGVADIRMHIPGFSRYMVCDDSGLNTKCELPLTHNGDLRAQWIESCQTEDCGFKSTYYPVNWPFIFKNFTPACCEIQLDSVNAGRLDLTGQEPVPILVASETTTATRTIPGSPARYNYQPIYESITEYTSTNIYEFDNTNLSSELAFVWNSGTQGYTSYESNINQVNGNTWYNPEIFEGRKALLQAKAFPVSESYMGIELITNHCPYVVEENNGPSKIIAIAGVSSEAQTALLSGGGDNNINLYANMVSKTENGGSRIVQLGGWTGRSSFVDAYSQSILKDIFLNSGNEVYLNFDTSSLSSLYDVCWIANPIGSPSELEVLLLSNWLNSGNKKLIITHDSTTTQINIVIQILELLNSHIRPLYLPIKDQYPSVNSVLQINPNHPIYNGFDVFPINTFTSSVNYVPFATNENVYSIAYATANIYDDKLITKDYLKINSGIDKVSLPVIPGSGYKIFIDTIAETQYENQPINIYIKNGSIKPAIPYPKPYSFSVTINDYSISSVGYSATTLNSSKNKIETISIDLQAEANQTQLEFYFSSFVPRIENISYIPKTCRLVSISGVLMPITSSVSQIGRTYTNLVGFNEVKVSDPVPPYTVTDTFFRPISSLNDRYCVSNKCNDIGFSNQFIADGPVIVAQEVESFSSFSVGSTRSRITLISDSSLVQGRFMSDEFGRMSSETVDFIKSLYPNVSFPSNNAGRQYNVLTKIVSPERGSPQKYYGVFGNPGSNLRFGGYGDIKSLSYFNDKESKYDPRYVVRSELPWSEDTPEILKEFLRNEEIQTFNMNQYDYGGTARFSGIINGTPYSDIGIGGGIPQIMKDTGSDYLDFDKFPSGYPGDLFGYSIALHKNKLIVGSPFTAFKDEKINPWSNYQQNNESGIKLSYNGGAGAAYVFEKTFKGSGVRNSIVPWEFIQKLRPDNINAGQDLLDSGVSQQYRYLGPNPYSSGYLALNSTITDQFGYDVSIDSDIIVVGAPGHDFDKQSLDIYSSGNFIRKAFNDEFDIPQRIVTDLGNSGIRHLLNSGVSILNNGAIFTFENRIVDWPTRTQKWSMVEKIIPQLRSQNSNENDNFGKSVYVHRSLRSDSDYVIVGGSENHDYSSSGTNVLDNAGAIYTHDIMLRESSPAIASPNSYIDVKVFGERTLSNEPTVRVITQNNTDNQIYYTSGIIYTDKNGAIFLEASGQDPSIKGFIQHRPFVVSVDGLYFYGTETSGNLPLFVDGNSIKSENINLFATATTGNVYNTLGLYNSSIVDFGSGNLSFFTNCPEPTQIIESGLMLFMASGIGLSTDKLNMRIRGY